MTRAVTFLAFMLGITSAGFSAETKKLDQIRVGYSSISSSRIALWVTNDVGFFKKQGLAAEVVVTPGVQGTRLSSPASSSSTLVE